MAENAGTLRVPFVIRTDEDRPSSSGFSYTVISDEQTATATSDYTTLVEAPYVGTADWVRLPALGVWEARPSVDLTILDDTLSEGTEFLRLGISRGPAVPKTVTFAERSGGGQIVEVHILDDEMPEPLVSITGQASTLHEPDEHGVLYPENTAVFDLRRPDSASTDALTVNLDVSVDEDLNAAEPLPDGTTVSSSESRLEEGEVGSKTVTFAAGYAIATYRVNLQDGDKVKAPPSTLSVSIAPGPGYGADPGASSAEVEILETDTYYTVLGPVDALRKEDGRWQYEVEETAGSISVPFALRTTDDRAGTFGIAVQVSTISLNAIVGEDFEGKSEPVRFGVNEWSRRSDLGVWENRDTFSVRILDDTDKEGAETFRLCLERIPGLSGVVPTATVDGNCVVVEITIIDDESRPPRAEALGGAAPDSMDLTPAGVLTANLTWTLDDTAPNNGGSPISGVDYRIKKNTDPFGPWQEIAGWSSSGGTLDVTEHSSIDGWVVGNDLVVELRAVNANGKGPVAARLKLQDAGLVTGPRNVVAEVGPESVVITWDPPEWTSGLTIGRYDLQFCRDCPPSIVGGDWTSIGTERRHVIEDLANGSDYSFVLRAGVEALPAGTNATRVAGGALRKDVGEFVLGETVELRETTPEVEKIIVGTTPKP